MRIRGLLLLVLGACGNGDPDPGTAASAPLGDARVVRFDVRQGDVTITTTGAGEAPAVLGDGEITPGANGVMVTSEADLELRVAPGTEIHGGAAGAIRVTGAQGALYLTSRTGSIAVEADGLRGGRLAAPRGGIAVDVTDTAPTRDLVCEAKDAITIELPRSYRGSLSLRCTKQAPDMPKGDPDLFLKWDATGKGVSGWAGERLSKLELAHADKTNGLFVTAVDGPVKFALR